MKKIFLLFVFIWVAQYSIGQNYRSNCPVKEETFTRKNSDGSLLTIKVSGNELIQYFETKEGFTVVENKQGDFEYAMHNTSGDLVGTGQLAANSIPPMNPVIKPHLKYSATQTETLSNAFYQLTNTSNKKALGKPFNPKGKRNVLAILVQYPDLAATNPKSNFDSLLMKPNYNGTGSFRDYYLKTSYGQLDLNVDVYGWYTATNGFLTYGKSNSSYMTNVGNLVKGAVLSADAAGVDFKKYDNDSDGYVDGIIIMHAGFGAEEQSTPSANNFIWSHRYNLTYTVGAVSVDGVLADAYGIFPEKRYNSGDAKMVGIGVISHEFGHLLDLPDLYSTQDKGEGIGNFANMAGGPWLNGERTPCLHDAWTRIMLGWVSPTPITAVGTYTIPKSVADSNFVYKISTTQANEYFLIENKQKKGFDQFIPGRGLAIWHINSNKARLLSVSSSNNVNNDTSAYGVGLLQADGQNDLEKGNNRGDAGDLFPGSSQNRQINSYTNPNSLLYYKIGGVKQPSNIILNNIIQNSDSSITFTFGNKPVAAFDPIPKRGCSPLNVNLNNTSSFANKYIWKLPDGSKTSTINSSFLFNTPGDYPVTLSILDSNNQILDSNTQIITVDPSPKAKYTLLRNDSNSFNLKSESQGALYVNWRFGTNQSSNSTELIYTLSGQTDVPFKLIAYTQNQCTDTAFGLLNFWPLGIADNAKQSLIEAFPNPFNNSLFLNIQLKTSSDLDIQISDIQGNILWKDYMIDARTGDTQVNIPTREMAPGMYFLSIKGDNINKILRVLHL